jgi:hypothetical protein
MYAVPQADTVQNGGHNMTTVDEKFLNELGMTDLTETRRKEIFPILQEELEMRAGTAICSRLTDGQILEYETIIENGAKENLRWLKTNEPAYAKSDTYRNLLSNGIIGDKLINDTSCYIWLQQNCPDYRNIVENCKREMRDELMLYKDEI